jgi:ABC-2 type transport system permease protein
VPTLLAGRAIAATAIGLLQGMVVLACAPLVVPVTLPQLAAGAAALLLTAAVSSVLGLLVAAPLQSIENFAGIINVVLFPLLFLSGALYPTAGMPPALRVLAEINPVSYAVDLMRGALGQPMEFQVGRSLTALTVATTVAFVAAVMLFDPERRVRRKEIGGRR